MGKDDGGAAKPAEPAGPVALTRLSIKEFPFRKQRLDVVEVWGRGKG